jgi:Family of unknown function (DUF5317)
VGSIAVAGGIAIAIVLVTRGSLRQLVRLRIQSIWLALLALTIQVVLDLVDFPDDRIDDLGFALLMASYALLLAFCFVNIRVPAMWIVALGIALNAAVIGLNQGMPTRDREVTTASGRTVERPIDRTVKHRPESTDDLLPFLGDQIVIPDPIDEVISVGDIVIGVGIVGVCYLGSRPRRSARSARGPRASAPGRPARRRWRSKRSARSKPPPQPSLNPLPVTEQGSTLSPEAAQALAAPEPGPGPEPSSAPEPGPGPEPASAPEPAPAPRPEPEPESASNPEPEPAPEAADAEPEPELEHAQARPAGDERGRETATDSEAPPNAKEAGGAPGDRPSEGDR